MTGIAEASANADGMAVARRQRILLSYATAGVSKVIAAAVQVLALPVVAITLGAERFGALLVLGAIGALCCLPARAIPPAASVGIAQARGLNDRRRIAAEFWSAGLISMTLGVVAIAIVTIASFILDPVILFGEDAMPIVEELRAGIAALVLLIFATYFLSWVEGVRTGYEENHLNNLFALAGSGAALVGIALAWAFSPTIPAFFVAIYIVYPLVQGFNLVFLPRERWSRAGRQSLTAEVMKGTARRALSWGTAQAGLVLHLQGSVYLAAQAFGLGAGALVGGMVRLFQILHNLLLALLTPVLPALSHDAVAGRGRWAVRTGRRAAVVILGGLGVLGAAIALFGDSIVGGWLSLDVPPDVGLFAAFGAMALLHIAAQLYYLMLLALGDGRRPSQNLLWAGVFGVVAGVAAMHSFGLAGLIWGQAAMMLLFGFAPITLRLAKRLGVRGERLS